MLDWFSLSIRRNRKSFMVAILVLAGVSVAAAVVIRLIIGPDSILVGSVVLVYFVPLTIVFYTLTAQRLRDIGVTGWLALLWIPLGLLPVQLGGIITVAILILLCCLPGNQRTDGFG
jgi:uncharacterized membrane protein YhaH (DUF805 family)